MLLAEAGCVFMVFILLISGTRGQKKSICVLKGSSVDLLCSARDTTSKNKWYTVHWDGSNFIQTDLSTEENRVTYMSEENQPALTIKDLRETDEKSYCCREKAGYPAICFGDSVQLHVADLQVKVIPTTEGQTVTLMCNTSCPLTEKPAAYIWYKNREFLYQDWSPWYQQLVSSDEAVTYSCAVKGYEDLRAPEVSVDSVTSTCINVTYAKGRMCSYKQTSVDEPCSITYPTEIHIEKTPSGRTVGLTCRTSCTLTDSQTAYSWYKDGIFYTNSKGQGYSVLNSDESYSCAVKDLEDLLSAEVCTEDKNCWSVNYNNRRICALKGSSVNISSEYSSPRNQQPKSKLWYKVKRNGKEEAEELIEAAGRVEYHDNMNGRHILGIKSLTRHDSGEYIFRLQRQDGTWKQTNPPGVTLIVTGLTMKFTPPKVTEDQRVTLTCSTSCPLPDNTTYIWYKNSRPLTLTENQHKHLVLDPVSSQHAGNYSCAIKTGTEDMISSEKTLTVQDTDGRKTAAAAAAGVVAVLLVIIALVVFLWIRRKRTSGQSPQPESTDNTEQINPGPLYETISAQPAEQDDLHYSRVHFSKTQTDPLYSTVQPHQPKEQEHVAYAVVSFRSNTTP